MRMKQAMICLMVMGLLMIGCASSGHKIDQSAVDQIRIGETTRDQVLKSMGSPDQIARHGNGDTVFTYMYVHSQVKAATLIPYVGMFVGGTDTQQQSVSVTFGPNGIVKDYVGSQGAMDSNLGISAGTQGQLPDVEDNKRPE